MKNDEKDYYIPKKLLGELVRVLITSTDPANILEFTSTTVGTARALMIKMLENQIPNPGIIDTALHSVFQRMVLLWNSNQQISAEEHAELNRMLMETFKTEPMMRYDIELYRDILFCEDLYNNWKVANEIYIADKSAWSKSNETVADIKKSLFEIIIRHNLMQLPYGDSFNLDSHGTDTNQLALMLSKIAGESAR